MSYVNIKAAEITATATVLARPGRVRALWIVGSASAGDIDIRDGGASGTLVLPLEVPANFVGYIKIPEDGIRCETDIHVTLDGNVPFVTVFYDG